MASDNHINTHMLPYMTDDARAAITHLEQAGADIDLAIAYLEAALPEGMLYEMPIYPEELREAKRQTR